MGVTHDVRIKVGPDVYSREFDGELILLDLRRGEYFGLNDVGMHTWNGLVAGRSPQEIAETLIEEYDVERATLLADILVLVDDLLARGLVVLA